MSQVSVRRSILDLLNDWESGHNPQELDDLMRAWQGIKALPPTDLNSFFVIAGYHGAPFTYRDVSKDTLYWGGYCNHGNVLFPTWHRAYVARLENALQSIIPGVMMAYWDWTSTETENNGIPHCLTDYNWTFKTGDQSTISNPLRSFVFPIGVTDSLGNDDGLYAKQAGYETVRYPLSGLANSAPHNSQYPNYDQNVVYLNDNIKAWIAGTPPVKWPNTPPGWKPVNIKTKVEKCLVVPEYTVFSNTTSSAAWNSAVTAKTPATAIESPHNDIHLAVGGFDIQGQGEAGLLSGANGDMGENNTAGFDPIFFFHHCNVDRLFWVWQQKNGHTDSFSINEGYQGSNVGDDGGQGPATGQDFGELLTMSTPLTPFQTSDGSRTLTSVDVINIKNLGYDYSPGSYSPSTAEFINLIDIHAREDIDHSLPSSLVFRNINRNGILGSMVVSAIVEYQGKDYFLGYESILSRESIATCENCQHHSLLTVTFDIYNVFKVSQWALSDCKFRAEFQTRAENHITYETVVLDGNGEEMRHEE